MTPEEPFFYQLSKPSNFLPSAESSAVLYFVFSFCADKRKGDWTMVFVDDSGRVLRSDHFYSFPLSWRPGVAGANLCRGHQLHAYAGHAYVICQKQKCGLGYVDRCDVVHYFGFSAGDK